MTGITEDITCFTQEEAIQENNPESRGLHYCNVTKQIINQGCRRKMLPDQEEIEFVRELLLLRYFKRSVHFLYASISPGLWPSTTPEHVSNHTRERVFHGRETGSCSGVTFVPSDYLERNHDVVLIIRQQNMP
jgi:hypothetical protein